MIYFDRKTLAVLRYIKRRDKKGASWGEVHKKFGGDANFFLLISFGEEDYTVTINDKGERVNFNDWDHCFNHCFTSFSTPKANMLIERYCFDFWKWIIPTVISVVALAVSALTA